MLPPTAPEAYPLAQGYPLSPRAEGRPRRLVRSEAAPCMACALLPGPKVSDCTPPPFDHSRRGLQSAGFSCPVCREPIAAVIRHFVIES